MSVKLIQLMNVSEKKMNCINNRMNLVLKLLEEDIEDEVECIFVNPSYRLTEENIIAFRKKYQCLSYQDGKYYCVIVIL